MKMKSYCYTVVSVVLVLLQVALVHCSVCPANARNFGKKCYSFHQQNRNWADAQTQCVRLGGRLATIERFSVNNFLFRNFRQSKRTNVWFGMKKIRSTWSLPDGKATVYRRWNTGEPNNVGGNEDCVEMWDNGFWNDAPCTQRRPFICEMPTIVNECALGNTSCHLEATCTDTMWSYICTCKAGFTGNGTFCKDIDECSSGLNSCHALSTCTNTIGSYYCTCPAGYLGNGVNCTQISGEHDKILQRLEEHDKATNQKLFNIEHMLLKLLGRPNAAKVTKPKTTGTSST